MKKRILLPLLLAAALLGLFFFTRYGLPQFYTPEWAARHVFWGCALIVFLPSIFGRYCFPACAFAGYAAGLVFGELFGGFQADVPPQQRLTCAVKAAQEGGLQAVDQVAAPLDRGFHIALAPVARPALCAKKALPRKAFCSRRTCRRSRLQGKGCGP